MIETVAKLWQTYDYVFLQGLLGTLWLTLLSAVISTLVGVVLAIIKLSKNKVLNFLVEIYLVVIRGTPILLQLYFFWLVLPKVMPFEMSDTACIVTALIVNAASYVAETIRSGIQAVDAGQTEAAKSLGMSGFNTMMRVVLPQAIKNILPALGNQYIQMMKQTSLASVFFVNELMTSYKTVQSATWKAVESLLIVGIIYLVLTTVFTWALNLFERRLKRSERTA